MANTVDTKVVQMKFDTDDFQKKVDVVIAKLEQLNEDIKEVGLTDAFKNLTKSAKDTDLSSVSESVDEVTQHFSTLEVMGITALANITNSAVNFGKKIISSIASGGWTRAMNIELANFQFEGLGVDQTEEDAAAGYYNAVMDAVLGTAYSYDVASKAASQLAASNIGVTTTTKTLADGTTKESKVLNDDMTKALLGIAGVASMTGSNFEDISNIFTRVAGQGRVMSNDLNSISSRGLNAAAVLGASLGKTESEVREMVTKGQISFDDFSKAMSDAYGDHAKDSTKMFTGALEDVKAALSRIGAAFSGPLLTSGRDILNSITPLIDVLNGKLTKLQTTVGNIATTGSKKISQFFDMISYGLKSLEGEDALAEWIDENRKRVENLLDAFGTSSLVRQGINDISKEIDGIQIDAIQMLGDYLNLDENGVNKGIENGTIGLKEFREAFQDLYFQSSKMQAIEGYYDKITAIIDGLDSQALQNKSFIKSMSTVKDILSGLATIIGAVVSIIKSGIIIAATVLKAFAPVGKAILDITAAFSSMIAKIATAISESEKVKSVLEALTSTINKVVDALKLKEITSLITGGVTKAFGALAKIIVSIYEGIKSVFLTVTDIIGGILDKISEALGDTETLSNIIKKLGTSSIVVLLLKIANAFMKPAEAIATVSESVTGLAKSIKDLFTAFTDIVKGVAKTIKQLCSVLEEITNTLKVMQATLQAGILIEIAIAIFILAGALALLSSIKAEGIGELITPLLEFAAVIAAFLGTFKFMEKILGRFKKLEKALKVKDFIELGKALIKIAVAVGIITIAVYILAKADPEKMWQAWAAVSMILFELAGIAAMLTSSEDKVKKMTKGLTGLIMMALAIRIIANAILALSSIEDPNALINSTMMVMLLLGGLVGVAWAITKLKVKRFMRVAISLAIMALAIKELTSSILLLSNSELGEQDLQKGLWSVVTLIITLGVVASLIGKSGAGALLAGVAMVLMAKSISMIMEAIKSLVNIDQDALILGLSVVIALLVGLALVLKVVGYNIIGAAAIFIIAEAINVLVDVLIKITSYTDGLVDSLYILAAALVILIAACFIFDAVPVGGILVFLGVLTSLVLIAALAGAAMIVIGIGMSAVAAGIKSMSSQAENLKDFAKVLAVFLAGVTGLALSAVGLIVAGIALLIFGAGLNTTANALEKVAVSLDILSGLSEGLKETATQIKDFVKSLKTIKGDATKVSEAITPVQEAFTSLYESIKDTVNKLESFGDVGKAAAEALGKGITDNIGTNVSDAITKALKKVKSKKSDWQKIGSDLVKGLIKGIHSQQANLEKEVKELEDKAERAVKAKAKIKSPSRVWAKIGSYMGQGLANGISGMTGEVVTAAENMGQASTDAVAAAISRIDSSIGSEDTLTITPVVDLSNVNSAAKYIDATMSRQQAMGIATTMSNQPSKLDVMTGNIISGMQDTINGAIAMQNQNGGNSQVTVEVPLTVNGREFARATVNDFQTEINKAQIRSDRLVGAF